MLVDWIVVHERPVREEELPLTLRRASPNVKWLNAGADGVASLLGRGLSARLGLPAQNETAVVRNLKVLLQRWPRLVAEYKPAFGAAFAPFLVNYTHWGYSCFDVVPGRAARFIERAELAEHHIFSWSFGDSDALYLRGQWTVHRNLPNVNALYLGCAHLGHGLLHELALKLAWLRKNEAAGRAAGSYHTRFVSAEGCYSHRALRSKGVRIKIATKQVAGLELAESAHDEVYVLDGALWRCRPGSSPPDIAALRRASASSLEHPACDTTLQPLQHELGEHEQVTAGGENCSAWVAKEYRTCAPGLKGRREPLTLELRDGNFTAHAVSTDASLLGEGGRCQEFAFFHMQEWKKRWKAGAEDEAAFVDPQAAGDTFAVSQRGGIRALPR